MRRLDSNREHLSGRIQNGRLRKQLHAMAQQKRFPRREFEVVVLAQLRAAGAPRRRDGILHPAAAPDDRLSRAQLHDLRPVLRIAAREHLAESIVRDERPCSDRYHSRWISFRRAQFLLSSPRRPTLQVAYQSQHPVARLSSRLTVLRLLSQS